jgi:hypothetical protein
MIDYNVKIALDDVQQRFGKVLNGYKERETILVSKCKSLEKELMIFKNKLSTTDFIN